MKEVDPNHLRLPPSRSSGADLWKLHQQIKQFGSSKDGMPLCADLHGRGLWDAEDVELLDAIWQIQRNFEGAVVTPGKSAGNTGDVAGDGETA